MDELLFATHRALEGWLQVHRRPSQRRLRDAIRALRTAHDPNQRHIRECAIIVALQSAGYKPPRWTQSTRCARELIDHDVDEALGYTSANHGAFLLAKRLTGLSRDLLDLVLGDQVTDHEILGHPVPPRARPILRALPSWSTPVISPPSACAAKPDRHEYARLHERQILELDQGIYRASHLALYGNFQLPIPPIRSLTNE